jgi:hypothetical protein
MTRLLHGASVPEEQRPAELKRIRRAVRKHFKRPMLIAFIAWTSAEPHTSHLWLNDQLACLTVKESPHSPPMALVWDGKRIEPVDLVAEMARCGCPECQGCLTRAGL